jgi:hypothetical protein
MKPQFFEQANMIPGEMQREYEGLPVFGRLIDGEPHLTSLWKPSAEELEILNAGGFVNLTIKTGAQPPVLVYAQSADGLTIPDDIGAG